MLHFGLGTGVLCPSPSCTGYSAELHFFGIIPGFVLQPFPQNGLACVCTLQLYITLLEQRMLAISFAHQLQELSQNILPAAMSVLWTLSLWVAITENHCATARECMFLLRMTMVMLRHLEIAEIVRRLEIAEIGRRTGMAGNECLTVISIVEDGSRILLQTQIWWTWAGSPGHHSVRAGWALTSTC